MNLPFEGLTKISPRLCRGSFNFHLRLQMSHVVHQLTTVFGSIIAAAKNKHPGKPS